MLYLFFLGVIVQTISWSKISTCQYQEKSMLLRDKEIVLYHEILLSLIHNQHPLGMDNDAKRDVLTTVPQMAT